MSLVEIKTDKPFITLKPYSDGSEMSSGIKETKKDFDNYVNTSLDIEKIVLKYLKYAEDIDDVYLENFDNWTEQYSFKVDKNTFKM